MQATEMLKRAGYEAEEPQTGIHPWPDMAQTAPKPEQHKPEPDILLETLKLAELVERADLVMLVIAGKRVGLGRNMQKEIVDALRRLPETAPAPADALVNTTDSVPAPSAD